jgi:hypothetical protein
MVVIGGVRGRAPGGKPAMLRVSVCDVYRSSDRENLPQPAATNSRHAKSGNDLFMLEGASQV